MLANIYIVLSVKKFNKIMICKYCFYSYWLKYRIVLVSDICTLREIYILQSF